MLRSMLVTSKLFPTIDSSATPGAAPRTASGVFVTPSSGPSTAGSDADMAKPSGNRYGSNHKNFKPQILGCPHGERHARDCHRQARRETRVRLRKSDPDEFADSQPRRRNSNWE